MQNTFLKWILMLLFSAVAPICAATAQVPPKVQDPNQVRPQSDQSRIGSGQSGTSYIIQRQQQSAAAVQLQNFAQGNTDEHPRVILPTSDRRRISSNEAFSILAFRASPGFVSNSSLASFTNYFFVSESQGNAQPQTGTWPGKGLQPTDLLKAYGFPAGGGGGALAIVDAYHYPNYKADLDKFSSQFSLPALPDCLANNPYANGACIKVIPQANGGVNCGWNGEAALDLQWAHAIAPKATLIFVEAASNNNGDLFDAVKTAIGELGKAGGGVLSLSWGGGESSTEAQDYDAIFVPGFLYVASSGDVGGEISYPAASPNVISVGGTGLKVPITQPPLEYGWENSGGGQSQYEPLPAYQQNVENIVGTKRNIPDISADADTRSGVAVYVSTTRDVCSDHPDPNDWQPGWQVTGGTSVAAPVIAGMINVAGRHRTSVPDELKAIYGNRKNVARIRDVTLMFLSAGGNMTKAGYDNVTGVGAPAGVDFDAKP